ncbi:natural cytotoxicity triggering receptor 3-like [Mauremys mutica]|uniref:natural cytotoxicity triggering receptor 3-like n=1 Tax=Mauremys mutica TaxID=74926 RepID=UPI001D16AF89|nr:natural cytotoxicity triggering receptor 3-like [Mauremys mutica]
MCRMLPIWLVLLGCFLLRGSEVRVHQPPELRASPGGSVLLNCTFSATPKASKLAVTWVRRAPGGSGELQIYPPPSQLTQLRSRLALDSGRFRHQRDASLHLANLTQHDAGLYRCFIWTSATSSHAGNGTELSVLGEGPGSGVQRWAACGPLGVLAPILLVLHAMVCRECQGLRHRRRSILPTRHSQTSQNIPTSAHSDQPFPLLPGARPQRLATPSANTSLD